MIVSLFPTYIIVMNNDRWHIITTLMGLHTRNVQLYFLYWHSQLPILYMYTNKKKYFKDRYYYCLKYTCQHLKLK